MDQRSLSYDVVVVGGGAAGLAAAVASAQAGARTVLVERYGFLGGMATAGMVSTICGLYHTSSSGPPEPLNAGFAETVAQKLAAMPGCSAPVRRGRTHVLPYTPFAFACQPARCAAASITALARWSFRCRRRNSTGSAPAAIASSSMNDSSANTLE